MKPICIEIVTDVLTVLNYPFNSSSVFKGAGVGDRVNKEILNEYPRELIEDLIKLADWMRELCRLYRHRIRINIIDAKSILGIYKCLRHRFRKYPSFIVDSKDVVSGWDRDKLSDVLDAHIQAFKMAR